MNLFKLISQECKDQPQIVKEVTDRFREKVITTIIVPELLEFEKLILELGSSSLNSQKELLSKRFAELKEGDPDQFIKELIIHSKDIIFFSNKEILSRLKELGLTKNILRWFVTAHELKEQFLKVNKSLSIQIRPIRWLMFIQHHLFMNVIDEIYTWAGMTGKARNSYYNDMHNKIYNLQRTKEYYSKLNKNFEGTKSEQLMNTFINELSAEETLSEKEIKRDLLQSAQGKTEKNTLVVAFNECSFHFNESVQSYIDTWELFKMIMPNRNLMDKDSFTASEQFETYERNYRRYQYYTLKKIIPVTET